MIMAEAEDKRLHNFFSENKRKFDELSRKEDGEGEGEGEDIELTLGLSLNGRFGFDPSQSLARSSSVSNFNFTTAASVEVVPESEGLGRTWSMPAATEEEWRRMKEAQSVRRMEAKRRRVEKMKAARDSEVENERMRGRHVSIGSQGSGSSGVSESEPQHANQVANIPIKARSPGSVPSLSNQIEPKETILVTGKNTEMPSSNHNTKEMMKNMMVDMPCVSTRGVGPSGKKVEGFLYRYRKGGEVRIVCVCHGSFLSPAEFVKHAGGADVAQPLKHIVVNPSPLV